MNGVQAGLSQPARELHRVVNRVADVADERRHERVVLVASTELHRDEEVPADFSPHGDEYFQQQTRAGPEVPVVLVASIVDGTRQELMEDVAVAGNDLDAVGPGGTGPSRGLG